MLVPKSLGRISLSSLSPLPLYSLFKHFGGAGAVEQQQAYRAAKSLFICLGACVTFITLEEYNFVLVWILDIFKI